MITNTFAQTDDINKTKRELSQLQIKIKRLEERLSHAQNKQSLLEAELKKTNQQIDLYYAKFKKLKPNIDSKEVEITELQDEIKLLDSKVSIIRDKISKYLVEQYKNQGNSKIKLILSQTNLQKFDKLMIYYEYMLAANKKLLGEFKQLSRELNHKQGQLNQDLDLLKAYQSRWREYLRRLHNDRAYQTVLIKRLSLDINKKQQTLQEYRQSQINLTRLITKLTSQSVLQSKTPLNTKKHHLIKPLNVPPSKIKKMNQGLIFYGKEGENARAISPGKVVFADWLNGYGLLMIIDHGWGFMSLYGNNLKLLKHVGDNVKTGEKITKIGHSGVLPENGLYFEIRHHGKAMPPKKWLQ